MRLGVYGLWDMCTGYQLARYAVERGESSTGAMEAVCWAGEEKDDPRLVMHGKFDDLWSDLGPFAKSSAATDLLDRLDIDLVTGEAYAKERMGGVERTHRTRWARFERSLFTRGIETILLSELAPRLIEYLVGENARAPVAYQGRRTTGEPDRGVGGARATAPRGQAPARVSRERHRNDGEGEACQDRHQRPHPVGWDRVRGGRGVV